MNDLPSEKELLALERAQRELAEAEAQKTQKEPPRPATVPLSVTWEDPDTGEEHHELLMIRVLNFDEDVRVGLVCAQMARGSFNSLPVEDAIFLKALATCGVMWGDKVKGPLSKLLHEDRDTTIAIYERIMEHRDARFRGDGGSRERRKAKVRLVSDTGNAT